MKVEYLPSSWSDKLSLSIFGGLGGLNLLFRWKYLTFHLHYNHHYQYILYQQQHYHHHSPWFWKTSCFFKNQGCLVVLELFFEKFIWYASCVFVDFVCLFSHKIFHNYLFWILFYLFIYFFSRDIRKRNGEAERQENTWIKVNVQRSLLDNKCLWTYYLYVYLLQGIALIPSSKFYRARKFKPASFNHGQHLTTTSDRIGEAGANSACKQIEYVLEWLLWETV